MKKIVIPLLIAVLVIGGGFGIKAYIDYENQLTGVEWFVQQGEYMEEMALYANDMDNIFALYIAGTINQEDFLNYRDMLNAELKVMQTAHTQAEKDNPIRVGSHTYASKKGCEVVNKCYDSFSSVLEMASLEENYSNVETLAYKYLIFQNEFIDYVADYMAARTIVYEENGVKPEESEDSNASSDNQDSQDATEEKQDTTETGGETNE